MEAAAIRRLSKELQSNAKDPNPALDYLLPVDDSNLLLWKARLRGTPDTPYQGMSLLNPPHFTQLTFQTANGTSPSRSPRPTLSILPRSNSPLKYAIPISTLTLARSVLTCSSPSGRPPGPSPRHVRPSRQCSAIQNQTVLSTSMPQTLRATPSPIH